MSSVSNLTSADGPLWNTTENHGPLVSVITWLLGITVVLSVVARTSTRYAVVRQIRADDITIVIALVFAIGQSVTVSLAAANGLGQSVENSSASRVASLQKNEYAAGILYILTLCLTKASLFFYLDSLTPIRSQKTINLATAGFTGLWGLSSLFVAAFQCKVPTTWDLINGKCIDTYAFWTYYGVVNILTDVALIFLPFMILDNLQVETKKKSIILLCFASRILTIAATIVQLCYLHRDLSHSTNLPYDLWIPTLTTQVVQALSIITACIPYLKPFLEALETGMIRAGGGAQKFGGSANNNYTNNNSSSGGGGTPSSSRAKRLAFLRPGGGGGGEQQRPHHPSAVQMHTLTSGAFGGSQAQMQGTTTTTTNVSAARRAADSDAESQSSRSKIIKKTVDWTLTDEVAGVAI